MHKLIKIFNTFQKQKKLYKIVEKPTLHKNKVLHIYIHKNHSVCNDF